MHIFVSKLEHHWFRWGLLPVWNYAIIWTNDSFLLIWSLGTNFTQILIKKKKKSMQENAILNMMAILSQP